MDSDKIENLYKYYGILADSDKESRAKYEYIYSNIIDAAKGSLQERKLASQFIPKFFADFPNLEHKAINAQFDLCEDDDLCVRKQAIRELPSFCCGSDPHDYTRRVADILAQLLQASEPTELSVVRNALLSTLKIDTRFSLLGIFNQIRNGEDRVREKCIDFIYTNMRQLPSEIVTNEFHDVLISEIKPLFQDASSEEIPIFFELLLWTSLGKTPAGKRLILDTVITQLNSTKCVSNDDEYIIDRFLAFVKTAKAIFSKTEANSNKLIGYFCQDIMSRFTSLKSYKENSGKALEVLKSLAEISCFASEMTPFSEYVSQIFNYLLDYLPLPDQHESGIPHQKLMFSYVECLLFTLHSLLKECSPGFLFESDTSVLKDFRLRLQYFARASHIYTKTLEELVKQSQMDGTDNADSKIKRMALKTISNINILIKDFFHNPPSYKSTIQLSWLAVDESTNITEKRKLAPSSQTTKSIKFPRSDKSYHREIYQPPGGKYSSKLFDPKSGGKPDWI